MRISAFVDGSNNKYSVFVDDLRCSPKEVNVTQPTYTVPLLVVRFSVGDFALPSLQSRGATENTVTFNESAACAGHSGIAESWR